MADDLDEMYEGEGNQLVKDFIKLGDKFVRNWTHNYGEGVEVECSLGRGIDDKEQEVDSQQVGEIEAVDTEEPNINSSELSFSSVAAPYSSPSSQSSISCDINSSSQYSSLNLIIMSQLVC